MQTIVPRLGVLVLVASLAVGCSAVRDNNRELVKAGELMAAGRLDDAIKQLGSEGRDDLCGRLDRATYLAALGRLRESNAEFDRALGQVKEYERRAVVSARETARGAGSLLVNDGLLEYQGEGFERVLIHTFKARNYLLLGDFEAARVEIVNANMRQDEERRQHAEVIAAAKGESKADPGRTSAEIEQRFAASRAILGRLDNVYQNPFASYLSGLVFEANGEPDEAFVDYKKAFAMVPSPVFGSDLGRLATRLDRWDEAAPLGVSRSQGTAGDTVVMLDNGFAPRKDEIKFPIPLAVTVGFVALPMAKPMPTDLGEAEIVAPDGRVAGRTNMVVDIEAMAVRNLYDNYPAIVARQSVRIATKTAAAYAAKEAANQAGIAGLGELVSLASTVTNAVTERADLRGWYSLPRSVHIARVDLPKDAQSVTLRLQSASGGTIREIQAPVVRVSPTLRLVVARYLNGTMTLVQPNQAGIQQAAAAGATVTR